nr:hypothetical protein [Candidatus Buchananbacteria bacterium]
VYSADRGINSDEVQVNLSAIDVINASTGEFFFRGNVTHLKKTFVEGHFKISNRTGQISFDASVSTESWWTRLGLRHTFRNAVD